MSKDNQEHDIEKIFQKAADNFPATFDEKNWQAMRSMLDRESDRVAATRKKISRLRILSLAAALFLSVLFYLLLPGHQKAGGVKLEPLGAENISLNQVAEQKELKAEKAEIPINPMENENVKKIDSKNESGDSNSTKDFSNSDFNFSAKTPVKTQNKDAGTSKISTSDKTDSGKILSSNPDKGEKYKNTALYPLLYPLKEEQKLLAEGPERNQRAIFDAKNNLPSESLKALSPIRTASSQTISSLKVLDQATINRSKSGLKTGEGIENHKNIKGKDQKYDFDEIPDPNIIGKEEKEEKVDAPIVKNKKAESLRPETRLSGRLVFGPDLSALHLGKFTTPGYSYGLMLHYHVNPKILIGAGVLQSTKNYLGKGSDYKIPSAYWKYATNDIVPSRVAGECAILEIPLDLQFNVIKSSKNNFFFSGGISSYFMLSESYAYTFNEPNPYANSSWSSDNAEGKHILNIINFSLGYERSISQRLKLGIAPYVKTPIKGIGWSNVKFVSMGTYFSIRYDLIHKIR